MLFTTADDEVSVAQRHNGIESQLEIFPPKNGTSSNTVFKKKQKKYIYILA